MSIHNDPDYPKENIIKVGKSVWVKLRDNDCETIIYEGPAKITGHQQEHWDYSIRLPVCPTPKDSIRKRMKNWSIKYWEIEYVL